MIHNVTIAARDGAQLAASVFVPNGSPRCVVIINSATAVPRKIYRGFAGYLAERGLVAVTYDYRGIAESRRASFASVDVRMRDWAELDVAGAIDHARTTWPALPIAIVGHSFGGQALGLIDNNREISRALLVAAQAAYWRMMTFPENYRVYVMMRLVGSPVAKALGYLPGWLGTGEDMPKGVFLEWTNWVMKPHYFFDYPTLDALTNFSRYRGALRAVGFSDDPWAPPGTIDLLVKRFSGAQIERLHLRPPDVGAERIGHFGFFRPEHRNTLWRQAAEWIELF